MFEQLTNLTKEINGKPGIQPGDSLLLKHQAMIDLIIGKIDSYVETHNASPVAPFLMVVTAQLDQDMASTEKRFAMLKPAAKEGFYGKIIKERIDKSKIGQIGSQALEFSQADTTGKEVALSSFRGKYVLIDFWASWCKPCRMENPNVVENYNEFKAKNFTVLGVSLDREKRFLAGSHQRRQARLDACKRSPVLEQCRCTFVWHRRHSCQPADRSQWKGSGKEPSRRRIESKTQRITRKQLTGMKILITGANGLLGQHLIQELLHQQFTVVATSKGPSRLPFEPSEQFSYRTLDITDELNLERVMEEERPDVVVHAAAMTQVDECEKILISARKLTSTAPRSCWWMLKPIASTSSTSLRISSSMASMAFTVKTMIFVP